MLSPFCTVFPRAGVVTNWLHLPGCVCVWCVFVYSVEAEKRQREEELENQRLEAERRAKEEEERKARQLREEREKVERERRAREEAERLEAARKQLEEEQAKLAEVQKDVDLSALVSGGQGGGAPAPGGDEAVEVAGTGGALSKMQKLAEKFGYDRSQDDHMADVLLKSPLFQKLLQLDEMIHMLNGSHKCYYAGVPYLDVSGPVKDRDLPREGELREVPAQDLSVGELALLNLVRDSSLPISRGGFVFLSWGGTPLYLCFVVFVGFNSDDVNAAFSW